MRTDLFPAVSGLCLLLVGCVVSTQPPPAATAPAAQRPTARPPAQENPATPPAAAAARPAPAPTPTPNAPPAPAPATPPTPAAASPAPAPPPAQTAKAPPPITDVEVEVYNNCKTKTEYCVDDGSQLYTFLSSNSLTSHRVRPGARIRLRKSNNCTDTIYQVDASSPKQKATFCK